MEKEFIIHLGDFGEHSLLEFDADLLITELRQSTDEELRALAEVLAVMFEKDTIVESSMYDSSVANGKKVRVQRLQYFLEELIQGKILFSFHCMKCNKRHDGKEMAINRYRFGQGKEYSCPRGHYIWNVTNLA
jgi:hypothetical protein